ncbi:MAG TPA: NADH-quinone oxidoreductase subunit N [Acidisarcina sp.]|nr:NADH-quinone oxidoreductase subunit N [Acidisarcina sp.]
MTGLSYRELLLLALPQTILVVAGLIALALDLTLFRKSASRVRFSAGAIVTFAGALAAGCWIHLAQGQTILQGGMLLSNPLTQLIQIALLVLAVLTILLSVDSDFTSHIGEYILLILLATAGMMFLVSTQDLLLIFISLELLSLCLYILTGFNKHSVHSAEAGLKYFLFGGMSAAFLLFGFSLLYGLSGSTNLVRIAAATQGPAMDPLLMVAIVMTVVGFGFKVAAVPFHLWAPDAYEGAPAPAAAFIASASKVASFFIFAQVMILGFAGSAGSAGWHLRTPGWAPLIAVVAAFSMILGNVAALAQTSVKRLLAYSAIAHAGYMLVAFVSHNQQSIAALLYYVLTYALTTIGAFGVVAAVERPAGGDKFSDFVGLSRRAPLPSLCMLVFLLSLAGIPPLAGFFGKFFLFSAALAGTTSLSLLWLVVLAVAMSAVSLYYYLQVLKRIYVEHPPADAAPIQVSAFSQIILCLIAIGVVVLGCAPNLLLRFLQSAVAAVAS